MPNSKKTYILDITDPLRKGLNSYWNGSEFALASNGPPVLLSSSYGIADVGDSATSLYQTRQKITVYKTDTFDFLQTEIKGLDFEGSTTSPTQGTIFGNKVPTAPTPPSFDSSGHSGPAILGSDRVGIPDLSTGASGQTFGEHFMSNFYSYLNSHSTRGTAVTDIVFETPIPTVTKDFSTTTDPTMGIEEVKEEFLINFLEDRYENVTSDTNVSELSLPNFYQTVFNGPVEDKYFDDYIENLPSPDDKYENVVIPMGNYDELKKLSGYEKIFPMEIKVSPANSLMGRSSDFYAALEESNLDSTMVDLARVIGNTSAPTAILRPDVWSHVDFEITSLSGIGDSYTETFSTASTTAINMVEWARDLLGITMNLSRESQNKFYLGSETLSIDIAEDKVNDLQKILASTIFLGKVKEKVQDNLLSFKDLNMGNKSYSETVFYQVEKYESETAPTPIQTFWIPNINQDDPIEYIDTQVKYNKEYFYKIHALNVVVGTKYYYDMSTLKATFNIVTPLDPAIQSEIENLEEQWNSYYELWNRAWDEYDSTLVDLRIAEKRLEDLEEENRILQQKEDDSAAFDESQGFSEDFGTGVVDNQAAIQENLDLIETLRAEIKILEDKLAGIQANLDKLRDLMNAIREKINDLSPPPQILLDPNPTERFEIDVITEPTVELIKTELFSFNGSILDDPPMIPHVSLVPYKGIDNKIIINMQAQIGECQRPPVILTSEESDYIDALKMSRGHAEDSMIIYKTDDEIGGFEIYRTETLPTSYEDFSNTLRASTTTLQRDNFDLVYSWGSSYEDTIVSNTVYYYMVRAVDIHGHKSYPSPVYRLKMVNDYPTIYPLIDTIEMMPKSKDKIKTKKFKKFIQLIPALAQQMVNYEDSGLQTAEGKLINDPASVASSISLGIVEPKLFVKDNNKTFKIRLTSKQTGKKLDLNVTFDIENESEK